jgi:probable O-glycosylation ligase (exosortase A-associated)
MSQYAEGWRTRGSRARVLGSTPVSPAARDAAPLSRPATYAAFATLAGVARGMPWRGVVWSLPLVGLLIYIWSATTYSVPLGEPAMILALVGLLLQREPLRVPRFLLLFAAMVAWAAFGYMFTEYGESVIERLDVLVRVGLIALVLVNALRTRTEQRVFMFVFLAAYAMYPVRGTIFNYVGGYTILGRALWNYIFANPNDLAALTLLQLSLALALLAREPKGWPRLAAIAGLFVLPVVILLTQSRGAIIGLVAFALFLLAGQKRRLRTLCTFVAVAGAILVFAPSSVWDRLGGLRHATDTEQLELVDEEGSAEQRFEIWKVASAVFADHPVAGVGIGAYPQAHHDYTRRGGFKRTARGHRDAHSTYLTLLAETGVVGFTLFMLLFGSSVVHAERVRRRARAVLPQASQQILYLEIGLLAFFTAGIFASYAGLAFTYVHLALLWTIVTSTDEELRLLESGPGASTARRDGAVARPVARVTARR